MIGQDQVWAQEAAQLFQVLAGYDRLPPNWRKRFATVATTIEDPTFPGAVLPMPVGADRMRVYALADSPEQWRRLRPLLMAFAGPTLTSFNGVPEPLSREEPVEAFLRSLGAHTTAILEVPGGSGLLLLALSALNRVRKALHRAPDSTRQPPAPTSQLLSQFQDLINVGDRTGAGAVIERLRSECRLDALNLSFLEVQLHAAFEDWDAVVAMSQFAKLCATRKPPAVSAALLEAAYHAYLAGFEEAGNVAACLARYADEVRPLVRSMVVTPPPPLGAGGWRIFALEAIAAGDQRPDLARLSSEHLHQLGWLGGLAVRGQAPPSPSDLRESSSTVASAQEALVAVAVTDSLSMLRSALEQLAALPPNEREQMLAIEPFKSLWHEIAAEHSVRHIPKGWPEWLGRIEDPTFVDALEIARRGQVEWPIDDANCDAAAARVLAHRLADVPLDGVAAERLADALPHLVAWLRRDPEFPRASMLPVYSTLLTLFTLGPRRGRGILQSSSLLASALLEIGLTATQYRSLLRDLDDLAGAGLGIDSVYWLLDMLEETLRFSAPDQEAREAFWHGALARLVPLGARLTPLQRAGAASLADALGWAGDAFARVAPSADSTQDRSIADALAGHHIAIYSLVESSSRQARAAILGVAPEAIVDCSSDHVGTARLKALAESADLFVVVALAAKHAATDFIRAHRAPDRPLLYARGRGFTSILRAVEDYALECSVSAAG